MAAKTVVIPREKRTPWVQAYLPELIKGMAVTFKHLVGVLAKPEENLFTVQYPEEKRDYPLRYRGMHRLMLREDGQVRCVACMCCSTICPADCIHIEAAEHDDPSIEKYPEVFVIDHLRCVVCGLCVEACPCDAIRMDTGVHGPPYRDRNTAFMDRDVLMSFNRDKHSTAKQGGKR